MPADFIKARSKAVRLLLSSRLYGLKFDITKLKLDRNIIFDSYSSFCANSLATLSDLTDCGSLRDGCTIRREISGSAIYLVLYNDNVKSLKRRRFTLAHEIGHIMLDHESDGAIQESEANRFAAELLLPRILVWELQKRTEFKIAAYDIAEIFGVSRAASENQMKSLAFNNDFSDDERLLLKKLNGLLPDFAGPVIEI